jgi:DEAD/DEAH box helicase domain-containing protein
MNHFISSESGEVDLHCRQNVILDVVDLETEPWRRETTGLWIDIPTPTLKLMLAKGINAAAAIHAAEHAFLNRFVLSADLKTECKVPEKEYRTTESNRKRPARYAKHEMQADLG